MGNTTVYTFNSWGLPESTIEPATTAHPNAVDRTWTTVYDKAGQAVTELLPGGVERERTYDGLGRLTHESGTGAEAATTDRTLGYDLAGRLTSVGSSEPLNPNTYTYNDRGQLLTADGPGGAVSYTYDADGNMTERSDAKNATSYGYDSAGRLEWLWNQMTGADIWYEWDAVGQPVMEQYAIQPEGSTEWVESARRSYGYDSLGRLTDDIITTPDESTGIATTTYAYDLDDRLTWKGTAGTAGAGEHVYGYDQAGRLSYWTGGDRTTHYEWDAAGNRVKAGSATATYDERNRLLDDGTSTYRHTPRGTLSTVETGTGSRTLTFDAFERKVTDGTSTYTYDSLDRVAGNGSTTFRYDGGSNNLLGDGTTDYSRTPGGSLLASTDGTTTQWYVTDQHTDLVAGLSVDGTEVTGSTTYDPFGTKTATEGSMPAVGYQSGWTDPDSGDVNMAARWYQPGTGGFTSRDTWQLDASPSAQANRYGYANADPLNGTDPTGHACICGGGTPTFRVGGGRFGGVTGSGRGYGVAPKNGPARTSKRGPTRMSGSTSRHTSSRAQAMRNAAGTYRLARGFRTTRPATSTGRPTTSRGCTYSCSSATRAHPRGPIRSSGTQGTGTVKPPKPPTPQNPNRGSSPRPAPVRPAPKPRVDVARVQERSLDRALVVDQRVFTEMALGTVVRLDPGDLNALDPIVVQPSTAAESGDASVEGPDRNRGNRCDTGAGFNAKGNIVYLPRREHAGECVATGAFANLTNADYTPPPRPGLSFPLPGLRSPPMDNRARGHLIGFAMSGSNKDTRNFVPMYQTANDRMYKEAEDIVVKSIKNGGHQVVEVTPVYGDQNSVVLTKIRFMSSGTKDVRCEFDNVAAATYKCW
ncbi:RHS repeat-associated core domain-containing protein [Streptomyces sp. AC558_RSS880]|uniref:RHS repeat-associated core domain-containing protein n=1 Tax=Streptomyces sp. AC558_RSS880 TaxID=2823687 RepID=UPI001C236364|nr:RHS repeat-associated core domain-containing protein [Streptomyces sp. AC558_RSS880]